MEDSSSNNTSDLTAPLATPFSPVSTTENTQTSSSFSFPSSTEVTSSSSTFILPSEIGSIQVLTSKVYSNFVDNSNTHKKPSKPHKKLGYKRTMSELYSASSSSNINTSKKTSEFTKRRILELGCNWGGKTTIFKSVKILYGHGFTEPERSSFRDIIFSNIFYAIRLLMEQAMGFEDTAEYERTFILSNASNIIEPLQDFQFEPKHIMVVGELWKLNCIQKAYVERNQQIHIPEIEYWLQKIDKLLDKSYVPDHADVLFARVKTTGIVYSTFEHKDYEVQLIDSGSERSERKKWYSCTEDVTDILYVVALDEFDMLCYEDNETNRLVESLNVFSELINSDFLRDESSCNVFVVFNKVDLFLKKFERGADLAYFFPDYVGGSNPSTAMGYIVDKFLGVVESPRKIHVAVTCALNTECMDRFWKGLFAIPAKTTEKKVKKEKKKSNTNFYLRESVAEKLHGEFLPVLSAARKETPVHEEFWLSLKYRIEKPVPLIHAYQKVEKHSEFSLIHDTDLILKPNDFNEYLIHVHSFVLSARCPLFYALVLKNLKPIDEAESKIGIRRNPAKLDVSLLVLREIINFIYYGKRYPGSSEFMTDAEKKKLKELNSQCKFMPPTYNAESIYETETPDAKRKKKKTKLFGNILKFFKPSKKDSHASQPQEIAKESCDAMQDDSDDDDIRYMEKAFLELNAAYLNADSELKQLPFHLSQNSTHTYDTTVNAEGQIFKAHCFILRSIVPSLENNRSYVLPPFLSRKSCFVLLTIIYSNMNYESKYVFALMQSLSINEIVDLIYITSIWRLNKLISSMFDDLSVLLISKLSPREVCAVYQKFAEDSIDFGAYIEREERKREEEIEIIEEEDAEEAERTKKYSQTHLYHLPSEVLMRIFSFLVFVPKSSGSKDGDFSIYTASTSVNEQSYLKERRYASYHTIEYFGRGVPTANCYSKIVMDSIKKKAAANTPLLTVLEQQGITNPDLVNTVSNRSSSSSTASNSPRSQYPYLYSSVFSFSQGNQQQKNEQPDKPIPRSFSQDECTFLLFVPFAFVKFLYQHFNQLLIWRSDSTIFSTQRAKLKEYIAKHYKEVKEASNNFADLDDTIRNELGISTMQLK